MLRLRVHDATASRARRTASRAQSTTGVASSELRPRDGACGEQAHRVDRRHDLAEHRPEQRHASAATPIQKRRVMSRARRSRPPPPVARAARAPCRRSGTRPGASRRISGCIGQVQIVPGRHVACRHAPALESAASQWRAWSCCAQRCVMVLDGCFIASPSPLNAATIGQLSRSPCPGHASISFFKPRRTRCSSLILCSTCSSRSSARRLTPRTSRSADSDNSSPISASENPSSLARRMKLKRADVGRPYSR